MKKFINLRTESNRIEFSGDFFIEDEGLYEFFEQYDAGDVTQSLSALSDSAHTH